MGESEYFKKMRLIPIEEYDRIKLKDIRDYDPELLNRVRSESFISQILANEKLSSEEKIRLLQANQFTHKSQSKFPSANIVAPAAATGPPAPLQPNPEEIAEELLPQVAEQEEEEEDMEDQPQQNKNFIYQAVNYLPEATRKRATNLTRFLDDNSDVLSVNNRNELVVGKNNVKNSNMTDILNYLFNPRKNSREPIGVKAFILAAKNLNMPTSFIQNRKVKSNINLSKELTKKGDTDALLSPSKSDNSFHSITENQEGKGKANNIIGYAKLPFGMSHYSIPNKKSNSSFKSLGLYKI